MFVASLPALVAVLPQIIRRFQTAPPQSAEARHLFNDLAADMGSSSFFGIGFNNYSYAGGWGEYKQFLPLIDQGGLAHSIYYISYAELGPLGPMLWTLMMLGFIVVMLRFVLKRRDGIERVFTIGVMAGFVIAMLIGKLEWNFRQTPLMFTYMMLAGLALSMPRVEKERRALERRKRKMQLWLMAQHARHAAGRRSRRQSGVKLPGRRVARHTQPARRDVALGGRNGRSGENT
jgi:hypothetical protein